MLKRRKWWSNDHPFGSQIARNPSGSLNATKRPCKQNFYEAVFIWDKHVLKTSIKFSFTSIDGKLYQLQSAVKEMKGLMIPQELHNNCPGPPIKIDI